MKKFFALLLCVLSFGIAFSQARYTTIDYMKVARPAVAAELPFPEKTVVNALEDKFTKMGYKSKETKNFRLFSGVRMPELGTESYDLYFYIDRLSRREKGSSTVTLMISKGYENFVTDSADAATIANAKQYLTTTLRDIVSAYDLELQIADQEDAIKKAEKKYNGLVDDGTDLQKKKRKIEEQIVENTNSQAGQKSEVEKQRQVLETLKSKRKQ
jgi:hypothetical protein